MALLGTKLETRRDLFLYKLGAALTMEKTILDMLPELEEQATHDELESALRMHCDQTQNHVRNIERAFEVLGEEPDDQPCPAIEGLEKEGQANLKMVDEPLKDAVIVSSVVETEHHELAVYEGLIANAKAMGEHEVVGLLETNVVDEREALQRARTITQLLAQGMPPAA
jgi:ferritin-like metal-binding protein YciE